MADSTPFQRMGDPIVMTVSPNSASTKIKTQIPPGATSFYVVNNNSFAVRLKGSNDQSPNFPNANGFVPVTSTTGWLFPPGFVGVFSTQFPDYLSVMSVESPVGAGNAGTGTFELAYGAGA